MKAQEHRWAIILAAGEGKRLQSLTTTPEGKVIPKQFCSWTSEKSMIRKTIERAECLVPQERIVVVVAQEHEEFWKSELYFLPRKNIIVQPQNKGTAAGLLLPLLHVLEEDSLATVLVFPSDHSIEEEEIVEETLRQAVVEAEGVDKSILLLGITPSSAESDYGWIIPASRKIRGISQVDHFVEKPPLEVAQQLIDQGGLWNSFMLVASATSMLCLYRSVLPQLTETMIRYFHDLPTCYQVLPVQDFSKDVLEKGVGQCKVIQVPECGWSDLGTPARLLQHLNQQTAESCSWNYDPAFHASSAVN